MNPDAAAKIKMLEGSQNCLIFGLISLATLIGVPFAVLAMGAREPGSQGFFGFCFFIAVLSVAGFPFAAATVMASAKVRVLERRLWNAARPYRIAGDICAMLAVIASFVVVSLLTFLIVNGDLVRCLVGD
jgi:hypothetical protein